MKLTSWEIKCIVTQDAYVMIDLEKRKIMRLHLFWITWTIHSIRMNARCATTCRVLQLAKRIYRLCVECTLDGKEVKEINKKCHQGKCCHWKGKEGEENICVGEGGPHSQFIS